MARPGERTGAHAVLALATANNVRIAIWRQDPNKPGNFIMGDEVFGDRSHPLLSLAYDEKQGHYQALGTGPLDARHHPRVGSSLWDVEPHEAGAGGDCLFLSVAYLLNKDGYKDRVLQRRTDGLSPSIEGREATRPEDREFVAARDKIALALRSQAVSHIAKNPAVYKATLADAINMEIEAAGNFDEQWTEDLHQALGTEAAAALARQALPGYERLAWFLHTTSEHPQRDAFAAAYTRLTAILADDEALIQAAKEHQETAVDNTLGSGAALQAAAIQEIDREGDFSQQWTATLREDLGLSPEEYAQMASSALPEYERLAQLFDSIDPPHPQDAEFRAAQARLKAATE